MKGVRQAKLGVRHILEGSVRRAGDTVRITAQLIDASTDQHEWSQSFDRPLSTASLFSIQDEIAKSIVDHLAATMGSAADVAKPAARKADTADEDAYDLYLGWEDSSESYSRAIENDGTNATAYVFRGANYAALGYLDRAMQDYQRCLDIDPAYELCRWHLAFVYLFLGRADDALRFYEIGAENGYIVGSTAVFAPAAAARGDRLGALSMLALEFRDDPQLIRPLFRALTDPTFSDRDRQDALVLVDRAKTTGYLIPSALWLLKVYDERIGDDVDPPIWWARDDAAWLKSQGRKRAMQHWHLPEYWRKHGFPPQCRPIGESDFECR